MPNSSKSTYKVPKREDFNHLADDGLYQICNAKSARAGVGKVNIVAGKFNKEEAITLAISAAQNMEMSVTIEPAKTDRFGQPITA